jgi:hypothetical protein
MWTPHPNEAYETKLGNESHSDYFAGHDAMDHFLEVRETFDKVNEFTNHFGTYSFMHMI